MTTRSLFGLALLLLALAVLVSASIALSPAAMANEEGTFAEVEDANTWRGEDASESFTVSSGGIDVIFDITYDADGAVTAEVRTWMLLPDETGYRAYVTERKSGDGDFVETGRGAIYDPDADGVPNAGAPDPQQAAALELARD